MSDQKNDAWLEAIAQAKIAHADAWLHLNSILNGNNVERKKRDWHQFLNSMEEIFQKLKSGAKLSKKSHYWRDIDNIRSNNHLLNYLRHARNTAYHGLESVSRDADRYVATINDANLMTGPKEVIFSNLRAGAFPPGTRIFKEAPDIRLVAVVDARSGKRYEVPRSRDIVAQRPTLIGGVAWDMARRILVECESYN